MSRSFGGTWLTTRSPMRDLAGADVLQPGDHAQQRRLAAARRADQHRERAVRRSRSQTPCSTSTCRSASSRRGSDARHRGLSPYVTVPRDRRPADRNGRAGLGAGRAIPRLQLYDDPITMSIVISLDRPPQLHAERLSDRLAASIAAQIEGGGAAARRQAAHRAAAGRDLRRLAHGGARGRAPAEVTCAGALAPGLGRLRRARAAAPRRWPSTRACSSRWTRWCSGRAAPRDGRGNRGAGRDARHPRAACRR